MSCSINAQSIFLPTYTKYTKFEPRKTTFGTIRSWNNFFTSTPTAKKLHGSPQSCGPTLSSKPINGLATWPINDSKNFSRSIY